METIIKNIFTLVLFITTITFCPAQEQDMPNKISLNIGITHIARQDLVFSPFIHNDFTPINIGLEYNRMGKYYQNLSIRFASFNPMLTNSYEYSINGETKVADPHSFSFIDLDYGIGKIIKKTEKSSTTVGALFTTDIQVLNYAYGRIGSFGYFSTFGLGAFVGKEYPINEKSGVQVRLALPLFHWLSRSPYLVNDDEYIENISSHSDVKTFFAFIADGRLTTLNKLQVFDLKANYTYQINKKWEFGVGYLFEFIHSKEPRNLLSYRNSLSISTGLIF